VTLDEFFEGYKKKKAESEKIVSEVVQMENQIAKEAIDYCMRAVYFNRKRSFFKSVPEDEAHLIFNDIFMECLKKGLEGRTESFSGALYFYYSKRMLTYIEKKKKIPIPVTELSKEPETNDEGLLQSIIDKNDAPDWNYPESSVRVKEIMKSYLDLLENLNRFQRDALILNVSGFSHDDIAYFLNEEKKKVSKGKFLARNKFREVLNQTE
jgi:hypothetical protein